MKYIRRVSSARRASSWVGEPGFEGGEERAELMGVVEVGGLMEEVDELWCNGGLAIAESRPNCGISWMGESSADDGAVLVCCEYFGVEGSSGCVLERKEGSMPSMGKVWLRGRWKLALGGGSRACWDGMKGLGPHPVSGEKAKGVVGDVGPPEKEEGAVSVKALESEAED